jgi:hypothetical protein
MTLIVLYVFEYCEHATNSSDIIINTLFMNNKACLYSKYEEWEARNADD